MNKPLYIYRASAGSGKTFTLAVEYIKLLIVNPAIYKRILAVTFTNKATGEMKERILSQLFGIAHALPSSQGYMEKLQSSLTKFSDEEIRTRAGIALEMILHDYGHFRIQTIDAFFQTILRSLAKELELSNDMEITLDGSKLLNEAVDMLIKRLTPTSIEMAWLVEYIEEHLSNDKTWKVRETIKKFAENILKEEYQERGAELRRQIEENNGALLADYRKAIRNIGNDIIERTKRLGKRFFEIATANNLGMDDFAGKSRGLWGHFAKLQEGIITEIKANGTVQKCIDTPSKISNKLSLSQCEEIALLLQENKKIHDTELSKLNSCTLSLARFHQLRLLNSIGKTLHEENTRENRFLLAQTTYLLSKMIENNTAFIFEKIGSEISHIFIDEFQDTSKLQWQCFKVLLEEMMAHGNSNLIVGDVKQSIYRWRNSDWNILNRIEEEFPLGTIADYGEQQGTTNYRSERRIIEFNNALFKKATEIIATSYSEKLGSQQLQNLTKAYSDVVQRVPAQRTSQGYAEICMIEKGRDNDFNEAVYTQLMETLRELLMLREVKPSDITILVREKKVVSDIAKRFNETFQNEKFSIISDDAYKLSSSVALKILIAAIRHIADPEDKINTTHLLTLYNREIKGCPIAIEELVGYKEGKHLLPAAFVDERQHLAAMPIYELIERLIVLFDLKNIKSETAFIYSFLDYVSQYLNNSTTDIRKFLQAWDEELCNNAIPAGATDSVRIMTIHKSKGLEFHTVIVPFATWKLTGEMHSAFKEKILWCKPKEKPFNDLDLLPIEFTNKMLDSIYSDDYNREYLFQLVDNLNLLYVACTRASKNLFIFCDADGKKDTISNLLASIIKNIPLEEANIDIETKRLKYGEIMASGITKEKQSDNPFIATPENIEQPFCSHKNRLTFRQSHNLARFLVKDKEEEERLEYLAQGVLLHELLSKLKTGEELERELKRLQYEGLISNEKEYDGIKKLMQRALSHPLAADWFSGRYKLFNECTILYRDGDKYEQKRPDRVMIEHGNAIVVDFKFAKQDEEHRRQVEGYINLLKQMNYENVKGYIWYIYKNEIKEVTP